MPIDVELHNHIRSKQRVADERLIQEREEALREAADSAAARGSFQSGGAITKCIEIKGRWLEKRVSMYLATYLETLQSFGKQVSAEVYKEVESELRLIAGLRGSSVLPQSMQISDRAGIEAHAQRELQAIGHSALSAALNRLKEAQLLAERMPVQTAAAPSASTHIGSVTVTGSNARFNLNSADQSQNTVTYDIRNDLDMLQQLSTQYNVPEAAAAAEEVKSSWPDISKVTEKMQKWVTFASSSATLMAKASPYLHSVYQEISQRLS